MSEQKSLTEKFLDLVDTVAKLRDPETGCPWDLKQNHQSLLPYLIEEAYEYSYAVENQSAKEQLEELGDVLLQVILNSQVAQDEKSYCLEDVCSIINEKLIRRHPHVFNKNHPALSVQEVEQNWKKIKSSENKEVLSPSLLKNPALFSSYKIGKKAKEIDFDWDNPEQVWEKVKEEFQEVQEAIEAKDNDLMKEEIGDLFFSLSQYARHLGEDPEQLAREANKKFLDRINSCDQLAKEKNESFADLTKIEKENLWKKVKQNEKMGTLKKS